MGRTRTLLLPRPHSAVVEAKLTRQTSRKAPNRAPFSPIHLLAPPNQPSKQTLKLTPPTAQGPTSGLRASEPIGARNQWKLIASSWLGRPNYVRSCSGKPNNRPPVTFSQNIVRRKLTLEVVLAPQVSFATLLSFPPRRPIAFPTNFAKPSNGRRSN